MSLASLGSAHKLPGNLLESFTHSSSRASLQPPQPAQEDKRNSSAAQHAAKLLESSVSLTLPLHLRSHFQLYIDKTNSVNRYIGGAF